MKYQRLYTIFTFFAVLFFVAAPMGPATAAQDSSATLQVAVILDAGDPNSVAAVAAPIGFTITVTNTAHDQAKAVVVQDQLDPAYTWSVENDGCSINNTGLLECKLGDLTGGESRQIRVSGGSPDTSCGCMTGAITAQAANAPSVKADSEPLTAECVGKVSLEKTALVGEVNLGEPVSYMLTIRSTGGQRAENVVLTDDLPIRDGLTWSIQAPVPSTCQIVSGKLTCTYPYIATGASKTVTVTSQTDTANSKTCGLVSNTASVVASNEPQSEWGNNSASADINIKCPGAQLSITKTPDTPPLKVGDPVGFTIIVTNDGSAPASNVVIQDELAAGLTWDETSYTECTLTPTATGTLLSCTIPSIAPNENASVHVTAATSSAVCGLMTNTASAEADNFGKVTATADVSIPCEGVNVSITKDPKVDTISLGGSAQFDLTVRNTSTVDAQTVILTDVLPVGAGLSWSILAPVEGCALDSGTLTCDFGTLTAGAAKSVSIISPTQGAACAAVNNTATVSAKDEPDSNLGDNSDSATITVLCNQESPKLVVTKVADASTVRGGNPIGFTLTLTNSGDAPATSVVLTDQLYSALTWTQTTNENCSISTQQLMTCNFDSLAVGETIVIHVSAPTTVGICGTQISNTAYAQAANHAQVPSNTEKIAITCVNGVDVMITKTTPKAIRYPDPNDPIEFTIEVRNNGSETAQDVVMTDPLPTTAGLSWKISSVDPASASCAISNGTLTCNFGSLDAGKTGTVKIVSPSQDTAGTITNTARVTASNETGTLTNNQSTAQLNVIGAICLNLNVFNGMYGNNFEPNTPAGKIGIVNFIPGVTPNGQNFLGDYSNQTVSLNISCLPPHRTLLVTFDLYIIRSWDGNTIGAGPDRWKMELEGRSTPLIDTTFSAWPWSRQAYPGSYGTGDYPPQTGAVATETLGYIYDKKYKKDSIYHIQTIVPHTGNFATFNFTGMGLQPKFDESWGIDNIQVIPIGLNSMFIPMLYDD